MNRRGFLSLLGAGAAAAATKSYFFFGGVHRPVAMTATEILERRAVAWAAVNKINWYINPKVYEMLRAHFSARK